MSTPRNRRRVFRKLAQAARDRNRKPPPPASPHAGPHPEAPDAVEPIVDDDALAGAATEIGPGGPSAPTEVLASVGRPRPQDSSEETEVDGALPSASSVAPDPPERLRFVCPCGAPMTATRETYDGRMRCDACGAVLLVALVFDPKQRAWRIEALRTNL
jgi:hypothetical protein